MKANFCWKFQNDQRFLCTKYTENVKFLSSLNKIVSSDMGKKCVKTQIHNKI